MTYSSNDYSNIIGMEGFSETSLKNHLTLYQGNVDSTGGSREMRRAGIYQYL